MEQHIIQMMAGFPLMCHDECLAHEIWKGRVTFGLTVFPGRTEIAKLHHRSLQGSTEKKNLDVHGASKNYFLVVPQKLR